MSPQQVKLAGSQWGSLPVGQHCAMAVQAKRPQQMRPEGAQKLGVEVVQHWVNGGQAWLPQQA